MDFTKEEKKELQQLSRGFNRKLEKLKKSKDRVLVGALPPRVTPSELEEMVGNRNDLKRITTHFEKFIKSTTFPVKKINDFYVTKWEENLLKSSMSIINNRNAKIAAQFKDREYMQGNKGTGFSVSEQPGGRRKLAELAPQVYRPETIWTKAQFNKIVKSRLKRAASDDRKNQVENFRSSLIKAVNKTPMPVNDRRDIIKRLKSMSNTELHDAYMTQADISIYTVYDIERFGGSWLKMFKAGLGADK